MQLPTGDRFDYGLPSYLESGIVNLLNALKVPNLSDDGTALVSGDRNLPPLFAPVATGVAATDTANLQAIFDAVPAAGGAVYIPAGTYVTNAKITIATKCRIFGDGSSDGYSPKTSGAYANQGNVGSTVISCSNGAIDCFSVEAVGVSMRDIHFTQSGTATAGCGVALGTASLAANGFFMENCSFFGFWTGVRVTQAAAYTLAFNKFYQHIKYGISIESTNNNGDEGDSVISGNMIVSGLAAASPDAAIYWTGGGGVKITGNKINREPPTAAANAVDHINGIWIRPADNIVSGVINIVGNSIENWLTRGIYMDTSGTTTGSVTNVNITGNEFQAASSATGLVLHGKSNVGFIPGFAYFGENTITSCYSMVKSELFSGLKIGANVINGSALGGPLIDIENGINIGYDLNEQHVINRPAATILLLDKTGTDYTSSSVRQGTNKTVIREMPSLAALLSTKNVFVIDMTTATAIKTNSALIEVSFNGFLSGPGAYSCVRRRYIYSTGVGTAAVSTPVGWTDLDYAPNAALTTAGYLTWAFSVVAGVITITVTTVTTASTPNLNTTFAGVATGEVRLTIDGTIRQLTVS